MSSIDSPVPPESQTAEQPTELEQEQAAVREAFELREGLRRLGIMAGVESITRNLEQEDAALKQLDDLHGEFMGAKAASAAGGSDDMRATAARDVTVNYYSGNPQTNTAAKASGGATVSDNSKPSTLGKVAQAALIAAALGGGPTTALVMNYLAPKVPAVIEKIQEAPSLINGIRVDEVDSNE